MATGKIVFGPSKPWEAYMHLGIVHFMLFPETMGGDGPVVETATKVASDDFFRVIEVRPVNDPDARARLKTLCDMAHLEIGVGAQPLLLRGKLNLANLDETGRKAAVEAVKVAVDQAYFFGARIMATLDGPGSYPGEEKKAAATERLAESLKELCAYAKSKATDYTLFISLETFDQEIDKKSLIGPSKDAAKLAETVRKSYANFGLTVDLSHMPLLFEKPIESLKAVQDHLLGYLLAPELVAARAVKLLEEADPCAAAGDRLLAQDLFFRLAEEVGAEEPLDREPVPIPIELGRRHQGTGARVVGLGPLELDEEELLFEPRAALRHLL